MADDEAAVVTTLPHSSFGAPDCCGCLNGIIRGDQADTMCNECDFIIRTVASTELRQTLTEMELTLDMCTELCPPLRIRERASRIFNSHGIHLSRMRKGRKDHLTNGFRL
jgi:hypothetical protein